VLGNKLTMGTQQSKFTIDSSPNEELIGRRNALHQTPDEEYVCIESNEKQKHVSNSPSLPIATVESWEHELLQDPKNRYVFGVGTVGSKNPKKLRRNAVQKLTVYIDSHSLP
jgi:hypothetical protein